MFGLVPLKTNMNSRDNEGVDNFFEDFFGDSFFTPMKINNKFSTDIIERDNEYEIRAELPEVKKEDIKLDFKNKYVVIAAKREDEHDETKDSYIRKECSYGEFSRSFYFDNVAQDKISAKFENGILKVTLPKEIKKEDTAAKIEIQ